MFPHILRRKKSRIESDDDREEDSVVSADKVTTRPVAPPPKPPPVQHRTAASASKAPPSEPHPRNDDSEVQSVALAAEMRRRSIRLKYGINEKDQEFYRRKGEDQEEFEKVNVVAHPAHTKMRKAKLKWKEKEKSGSDVDVSKTEKSVAEGSDDSLEDEPQSTRGERDRVEEIKRRAGCQKTDSAERAGSTEATLTELRILIIRIEELELANRKLRLQMRRMKKKLAEKEKRIEHLQAFNMCLQKASDRESNPPATPASPAAPAAPAAPATPVAPAAAAASVPPVAKEPENVEKPSAANEAVAIRGLEIMQRNQLLEKNIRPDEGTMLKNFFEATDPKPSPDIILLIDNAFSYAIDVILMRPDLFDDFVDNELRLFLLDAPKAKRILLDVMLAHPEYVPRSWGGDVLIKRQQHAKLDAELKERRLAEPKTAEEDTRPAPPTPTPPAPALQPPQVAQPPIKRAPTPPPMSKPSKPATRPPPPPPTASKPPPPPPAPKKPTVVQPAVDNKKVVRQKPSQAVKQPTRQRPSTK
ncbi:hypothetical protein Q1695_005669 [Nippostrongylus brasiliensis]|nr:hypothetical protein Q1695_005669 [Nippostrongylus brasiliensis]